MGKYDDIIHLPHHQSATRAHMPLRDRAAQFAPFAALTGYERVILEAGRETGTRVELEPEEQEALNARLRRVAEHPEQAGEVSFTFFQPDSRKAGGAYRTVAGRVKRVDAAGKRILLEDGTEIPVEALYGVDAAMFRPRERFP